MVDRSLRMAFVCDVISHLLTEAQSGEDVNRPQATLCCMTFDLFSL
jgi:hypothetical protein